MEAEEDSEEDNDEETAEPQSPETQLVIAQSQKQFPEKQEVPHLSAMSAKLDISDYTRQMEEVRRCSSLSSELNHGRSLLRVWPSLPPNHSCRQKSTFHRNQKFKKPPRYFTHFSRNLSVNIQPQPQREALLQASKVSNAHFSSCLCQAHGLRVREPKGGRRRPNNRRLKMIQKKIPCLLSTWRDTVSILSKLRSNGHIGKISFFSLSLLAPPPLPLSSDKEIVESCSAFVRRRALATSDLQTEAGRGVHGQRHHRDAPSRTDRRGERC